MDKLQRFKEKQYAAIQAAGPAYVNGDFLLAGDFGKHYEPRYYEGLFYNLVEQEGLEKANFHCLRHTFAARCFGGG